MCVCTYIQIDDLFLSIIEIFYMFKPGDYGPVWLYNVAIYALGTRYQSKLKCD